MKKISLLLSILILFSLNISASSFTKMATAKPILVQEGAKKQWCSVCGMNLKMFYKTSHIAQIQSHKKHQYCSMRCLVVDMKEHKLKDIKVVDAKSEKIIDADKAFYLLGSKIRGTMSKKSKLAFEHESDAKEFQKTYKGKLLSFNEALKNAKESLSSDMAMVTRKKEKKMYPMGKKIFEKRCESEIDLNTYGAINELKEAITDKKLCKSLNQKHLQALALYLWEVKRFSQTTTNAQEIVVKKSDKCSICGMFVYKYPRWATQIFYADSHHTFDGVKDMMKYYFEHKKGISKILVLDYYSQRVIDAREAFYVVGSDVYGPMGNELIAFKSRDEAKTFYKDHRGAKILEFKEIQAEEVYKLDE